MTQEKGVAAISNIHCYYQVILANIGVNLIFAVERLTRLWHASLLFCPLFSFWDFCALKFQMDLFFF